MNKTAAFILAALVTGASLRAEEASSYSVSLDFPYVSDYVFRGMKFADDAIQPSVEFSTGNFTAGVWTSMPITNTATNEFDFYAGYGVTLNDTWSLDLGACYYFYPQTSSGDEQFEPYIGLSGEMSSGLSTSLYYFYETEFDVSTLQASLGYSTKLSDSASLDYAADYGFVMTDGPGDYNYWTLSATFNYSMSDTASTYFGLVYAGNDIGGGYDGSYFYFNTGISIGF